MIVLSALATSIALAEGPLLVQETGGLGRSGKSIQCRLSAEHPELKPREAQLRQLIAAAARAPFSHAEYRAVREPSVEFYAFESEKGRKGKTSAKKIVLSESHQGLKERQGPEAKELIDLTKRLCEETRP